MKRVLAATIAAAMLIVGTPSAKASPPHTHGRQPSSLDNAVNGQAAIARLPGASAATKRLIALDHTLYIDDNSNLVYIEEVTPPPALDEQPLPAFSGDASSLHSRPGAAKAIYLDTDGHDTYETGWNIYDGETGESNHIISDPWPGTPQQIHALWLQVAEDFAAWDVDVTTQEPSASRIGMRVVISPTNWYGNAGGVARLNSWNTTTPVFVFTNSLGSVKSIGEASTHETGHALSLKHDGYLTDAYYYGHGTWAPIMGVGYSRQVTTWSKGEYTGANNTEDDIAIVSARIPVRPTSMTGLISTRADADRFPISGPVRVTVVPSAPYPNLDAALRLYSLSGSLLAVADPVNVGAPTLDVPAGDYLIEVDGVGSPDYTDYSSIGRYSIVTADVPTTTTTTTLPTTTTTTTVAPTTTTMPTTTTTTVPAPTTTKPCVPLGNSGKCRK